MTAAIEAGFNTRPAIIALGAKLGLDPEHVAIVLHKEAGDNAERHRWRRDADGNHRLHA